MLTIRRMEKMGTLKRMPGRREKKRKIDHKKPEVDESDSEGENDIKYTVRVRRVTKKHLQMKFFAIWRQELSKKIAAENEQNENQTEIEELPQEKPKNLKKRKFGNKRITHLDNSRPRQKNQDKTKHKTVKKFTRVSQTKRGLHEETLAKTQKKGTKLASTNHVSHRKEEESTSAGQEETIKTKKGSRVLRISEAEREEIMSKIREHMEEKKEEEEESVNETVSVEAAVPVDEIKTEEVGQGVEYADISVTDSESSDEEVIEKGRSSVEQKNSTEIHSEQTGLQKVSMENSGDIKMAKEEVRSVSRSQSSSSESLKSASFGKIQESLKQIHETKHEEIHDENVHEEELQGTKHEEIHEEDLHETKQKEIHDESAHEEDLHETKHEENHDESVHETEQEEIHEFVREEERFEEKVHERESHELEHEDIQEDVLHQHLEEESEESPERGEPQTRVSNDDSSLTLTETTESEYDEPVTNSKIPAPSTNPTEIPQAQRDSSSVSSIARSPDHLIHFSDSNLDANGQSNSSIFDARFDDSDTDTSSTSDDVNLM